MLLPDLVRDSPTRLRVSGDTLGAIAAASVTDREGRGSVNAVLWGYFCCCHWGGDATLIRLLLFRGKVRAALIEDIDRNNATISLLMMVEGNISGYWVALQEYIQSEKVLKVLS